MLTLTHNRAKSIDVMPKFQKMVPITYEAFMDYREKVLKLSKGKIIIKKLINDEKFHLRIQDCQKENGMN